MKQQPDKYLLQDLGDNAIQADGAESIAFHTASIIAVPVLKVPVCLRWVYALVSLHV